MPNPSAEVSSDCSGRISPKSKPCEGSVVGDDVGGGCGEASGVSCVIEREAFAFAPSELRGFPTRLANDCALFDTWSSATNLGLCERESLEVFPMSEAPLRRVEYDGVPSLDFDEGLEKSLPARAAEPGCEGTRGIDEGLEL